MHQRLLRQASTFFKNAFDGKIEREEDVDITHPDHASKGIALTNEDPKIFKRFNDWLYTHRLCTGDEKAIDLPWSLIVDTYVFAENRGIPRLQNTCIDAVIKKMKNGGLFPSQEIINPIWTTTNGNIYPLWLLLLHQFAAAIHCRMRSQSCIGQEWVVTSGISA